jgi:hypothetical protein
MSLVKLRIEIERELRRLIGEGASPGPMSIGPMVAELQRTGRLPMDFPAFRPAIDAMNRAAHGYDIDPAAAEQAAELGAALLDQLRRAGPGDEE